MVLEDIDRRACAFAYWAVTISGRPFQAVPLAHALLTPSWIGRSTRRASRPPIRNACRLSHGSGLGYSRFARHY